MKTIGWLIRFGLDRICVLVWVQIGDHRCVCCVGAYGVKQSQCSSVRIKTLSRGNLFCDEPVAIKGLLTLSLGEVPQQHVALHPGQASLHPFVASTYIPATAKTVTRAAVMCPDHLSVLLCYDITYPQRCSAQQVSDLRGRAARRSIAGRAGHAKQLEHR